MAIFRNADRAKRHARAAYHASAMHAAINYYSYSDPEEGMDRNIHDAWDVYRLQMEEFGLRPVTYSKFVKELHQV